MESSPRLRVTPAPATSRNSREPRGVPGSEAWATSPRCASTPTGATSMSPATPARLPSRVDDSNRELRAQDVRPYTAPSRGWVQSDGLGRGQQAAVRRPMSHTPPTDEQRASRLGVGSLLLAVPAEVATNSSRRESRAEPLTLRWSCNSPQAQRCARRVRPPVCLGRRLASGGQRQAEPACASRQK
jgi:hypothetical protein